MQQKNILLAFLLFISIQLFSQSIGSFPSFKDNPKWFLTKTFYSFSGFSYASANVSYQSDTLLCGQKYSAGVVENKPFYVRTEGLKTYLKNNTDCSKKEEVIYDFGLKQGDSLTVSSPNYKPLNSFFLKVKSVDSIFSQGKKLRRLKLDYAFFDKNKLQFSMDWIEGIGSNEHPIYSLVPLTSYALDGVRYNTNCAYRNNALVYGNCAKSLLDTAAFPMYEDAAYWNVGRYSTFFPPANVVYKSETIKYKKDTTICSLKYSIINLDPDSGEDIKAYIRREGKEVYALLEKENNCFDENLLYDFGMQVGESRLIKSLYFGGKEHTYQLIKIEKATFLGKNRKKFTFEVSNWKGEIVGQKVWIEGIGSLIHPFEAFFVLNPDGYWYDLLCSGSNQQQQYMNPKYNFCTLTVPTNDISVENIEVQIFPNPFYNNLIVNILDENNSDFKMILYNNIGQEVMLQNVSTQSSLDVADLPQGVYFIKIMDKTASKSVIRKIVKL